MFSRRLIRFQPTFRSIPYVSRNQNPAGHRRLLLRASLPEYKDRLGKLFLQSEGQPLEKRDAHNEAQARFFSQNSDAFLISVPEAVEQRIGTALQLVPALGLDSRVLDVSSGGLDVVRALKARGVRDVVAVDVSEEPLAAIRDKNPPTVCGNDLCVRTWRGDVADLPSYMGPVDLVVFCGSLGRSFDARDALLRSSLLLQSGGHVLICEPLGRDWQNAAAAADPRHMPHALPGREGLEALTADLPLEVVRVEEGLDGGFAALLHLPPSRRFEGAPIYIEGNVTTGFGRGSKQMGVPTANLPPEPLEEQIGHLPVGVYFGWAQLPGGEGSDGQAQKMVMNIGYRPTCDDGGGMTVELHIMHVFEGDFYGAPLKAVVLGYIRPEMRFGGIDDLVSRIKMDIGVARAALDRPELLEYRADPFFQP
uniref:riboflavin kinase n=1 Tax=Tetraselmis sp. GSL018 TaxID=582737 RepID=A0A061RB93_9CHLO